jgi:hypothetical protein
MESEKLHLKFYARPNAAFDADRIVPVFHRFIRERAFDELLIDVADYQHVKHGPGIVLVGDANDYYLDDGGGRLGLMFSRKRHGAGPDARLREAFARGLRACKLLEAAPELEGKLRFDTSELLVRVPDRLRAPNDDATYEAVTAELRALCSKLYAGAALQLERGPGAPAALEVRAKLAAGPEVTTLLAALGG